MILLYIYAGVSAAAFVATILVSLDGAHIFKQRYPGMRIPKSHWSSRILTWTKVALISAIPVFNVFYLLFLIIKSDELAEAGALKVYMKCMSDNKKEEANV